MTDLLHRTLPLFETLVAFDTTSRLTNLPLIRFIEAYLADHGIASELVFDETGTKANLFATIGDAERGGVMLSGHTDVVPVDGQNWSSDPFTLVERGGLLHGRGTCDMKGFIACVLALVPDLVGRSLAQPVHLAFSHDEEVGCIGVRSLIDRLARRTPKPTLAIVGEPTGMKVVDTHKGIRSFVTTVTGREAHSSQPQAGANAIIATGRLIAGLERVAEELRLAGDPSGRFTPGHTTVGIGTIAGGTANNIVARECRLGWEYRPLPDADQDLVKRRFDAIVADEVLPLLRATAPDAAVSTLARSAVVPLRPDPGSEAEVLAKALCGANHTHAVSYTTEGGLFQQIGIPTVICGPGDILQAHAADEFVSLDQLALCLSFLERLSARLA
ncbi:acetylornithine deacetylase [Zavarzinia sp. CC-PAN008]|uniref:acetylornithine deacetylase n=1 Tax=Zavarzinia sp. CC-PAN008 TaxID=3243332 RepID=UPI003F74855F